MAHNVLKCILNDKKCKSMVAVKRFRVEIVLNLCFENMCWQMSKLLKKLFSKANDCKSLADSKESVIDKKRNMTNF